VLYIAYLHSASSVFPLVNNSSVTSFTIAFSVNCEHCWWWSTHSEYPSQFEFQFVCFSVSSAIFSITGLELPFIASKRSFPHDNSFRRLFPVAFSSAFSSISFSCSEASSETLSTLFPSQIIVNTAPVRSARPSLLRFHRWNLWLTENFGIPLVALFFATKNIRPFPEPNSSITTSLSESVIFSANTLYRVPAFSNQSSVFKSTISTK